MVGHAWRSLSCQSTDQQNYHGTVTSHWPRPSPHPLQHRINRLPLSVSLRSACQCPPTDPDLWPLKSTRADILPRNLQRRPLVVCLHSSLWGSTSLISRNHRYSLSFTRSQNLTTQTEKIPLSRVTYFKYCSTWVSVLMKPFSRISLKSLHLPKLHWCSNRVSRTVLHFQFSPSDVTTSHLVILIGMQQLTLFNHTHYDMVNMVYSVKKITAVMFSTPY